MTSKEIEALVQKVQDEMEQELGVCPEIYVDDEWGTFDVKLHYSSDEHEVTDNIAECLTDDELSEFLTSEIHHCIRDFYYGMEHGGAVVQQAKVTLAEWIATAGGDMIVPHDVYVDVRWKSDGDRQENKCICCDRNVYAEQQADDFDPNIPLSNGMMDDAIFFYCNGIQEFFKLCENDNGEDFEIINVHGWD